MQTFLQWVIILCAGAWTVHRIIITKAAEDILANWSFWSTTTYTNKKVAESVLRKKNCFIGTGIFWHDKILYFTSKENGNSYIEKQKCEPRWLQWMKAEIDENRRQCINYRRKWCYSFFKSVIINICIKIIKGKYF